MQFYMFQMDESQPERCAEMLARRGFSAVVGVSSARSIAALRENGLRAYGCAGAFGLRPGDAKCVDVDGAERVWFSSGCPNDPAAAARREREWRDAARTEGLSGLFIDGLRFASPASPEGFEGLFTCFCPHCEAKMRELGMDPATIRREVRRWRDGERPLPPAEWLAFRCETVDRQMRRFCDVVRAENPSLKLGAFLFPPSLGALVGQTTRCHAPLDVVAPMLYRQYREPDGPATLNHEYHWLEHHFGRENVERLTGTVLPENVLQAGFEPSVLEAETRAAQSSVLLAPILQLEDERLSESIAAARRGGAQAVGFFAYNTEALKRLPELAAFSN